MQAKGRAAFIASFLAPAVILYGLFVVYPLIQAFWISMFQWRGVSTHKTFVGADNFRKLAVDDVFLQTVKHSVGLFLIGGLAVMVLGVAVAHALQSDRPAIRALRGFVLFPQMISLVAVGVMWTFLLNPNFGLLTTALHAVHLNGWVHTWLAERATALPSVGVAFVWYSAGFTIMLFSAALRSLPAEVAEAAALDGATGLRRFWKVTWPMLWSVRRIAIVNLVITTMNVFALVQLMTQGGPDRASEVLLTYLYESAFTNSQFGYATAIAVVDFALVMALSATVLVLTRRNPEAAR